MRIGALWNWKKINLITIQELKWAKDQPKKTKISGKIHYIYLAPHFDPHWLDKSWHEFFDKYLQKLEADWRNPPYDLTPFLSPKWRLLSGVCKENKSGKWHSHESFESHRHKTWKRERNDLLIHSHASYLSTMDNLARAPKTITMQ